MKTAFALLASMMTTAAGAQHLRGDINFPKDQSMNPSQLKETGMMDSNLEFDLRIAKGVVDPEKALDLDHFSGEVTLEEHVDTDRDLQFLQGTVCQSIQDLFSGRVACNCGSGNFFQGTVDFDCKFVERVAAGPVSFSPSYTGIFNFRILQTSYSFTAGVCAEALAVDTPQFGLLNLGNFCFGLDYSASFSPGGAGLQMGITSCTVQGGFFVTCNCSPCSTAAGTPGVSLDCQGANVPIDVCLPIRLPFNRNSDETPGDDILDGIDMSPAIQMAVEQRSVEITANKQEQEENQETPNDEDKEVDEKTDKKTDKKKDKKTEKKDKKEKKGKD